MGVPRWTTGSLQLHVGLLLLLMIPTVWCGDITDSTHPPPTTNNLRCYACSGIASSQSDCGNPNENTTTKLASENGQGCFALLREGKGGHMQIDRGDLTLLFNGTTMMGGIPLPERDYMADFSGYVCNTNLCNARDPQLPVHSSDNSNHESDYYDEGPNPNTNKFSGPPNSYIAAYPVFLLPVVIPNYGPDLNAGPYGGPYPNPSPQANRNGPFSPPGTGPGGPYPNPSPQANRNGPFSPPGTGPYGGPYPNPSPQANRYAPFFLFGMNFYNPQGGMYPSHQADPNPSLDDGPNPSLDDGPNPSLDIDTDPTEVNLLKFLGP